MTVLKHPINDAFPDTELTPLEAKLRLGIDEGSKTLLFLGRIRPYKGLYSWSRHLTRWSRKMAAIV